MTDVAVIGGGIAGCMAAYALKQTAADVLLIERHADVGNEASGNPYGLVMPQLSIGRSAAAEFSDQAYQAAIRFYGKLDIEKHEGVLQCAVSDDEELRFAKLAEQQKWDEKFCVKLDAGQASDVLGVKLPRSALWFPQALTLSPKQLCRILSQNIRTEFSMEALELQYRERKWQILDRNGDFIAEAGKIIVANAMDALRFSQTSHLPLRPRRGQLSFVPANEKSRQIKTSFTFGGYMTRALNDMHVLGATYEAPHENPSALTEKEHQKNLTKLDQILPGLFSNIDVNNLSGRASVRTTTPDHMPVFEEIREQSGLYVFTGLGSRGLTTAPLCAERICKTMITVKS